MKLRVLFFSLLRDISGAAEVEWELETSGDATPTMGDLLESLYARWPGLRTWDGRILVAVDLEYVGRDHPLSEGQEIAIMPPVQGG